MRDDSRRVRSPSRYPAVVVATALLLPACSERQNRLDMGALNVVPGSCYDIAIAAWPDSFEVGADSMGFAPSPRVRLDSTWTTTDSTARSIADLPGVMPGIHTMASWQRHAPDSVLMIWSTGYTGVGLHLGGTADTLTGTAVAFHDDRGGAWTPARAVRVGCAAPIPTAARAVRRFRVAVPLASGDSLEIGARVPDSLWVGSEARRWSPDSPPVGAFRGADSSRVDLGPDGRIVGIWLLGYPSSVTVPELAARLEGLIGRPTGSYGVETMDGDPLDGVYWADRYTRVSVTGPELVRISIRTQRR